MPRVKSRRGKRPKPRRTPSVDERADLQPPRRTAADTWSALLLVAVGALVYANSLSGPFVLDDFNAITNNGTIRQMWPPWDALSPPAQTPVAGRPVVNLSLALNYAFGALEVQGYHLMNILVHLLCALTLFGVVRRTLLTAHAPEMLRRGATGTALACALIWIVHPLQTESVNYITQRTESIMGLFYLLTLYTAIRANESPGRWWGWAAVMCCALGMASKEVMVTAPAIVLLYDRTFLFGSFRAALRARWRLYIGLAATWGVLMALMWSGPRANTVGFATEVGGLTYVWNQCRVIVDYLRLSLWPDPLIFYYGPPQPLSFGEVMPSFLVVGVLLVATAAAVLFRPAVGFLGAWFFVILLPTSSFIPIATEVAAERRLYLPLAALVVLAVTSIRALIERVGSGRRETSIGQRRDLEGPIVRWTGLTLVVLVVGSLGLFTVLRNADYRDRVTLWRSVVDGQPTNWGARNNLGAALRAEGRGDEALREFRQSLELQPDQFDANYNLGNELLLRGEVEEAVVLLRQALDTNERDALVPQAHQALGMGLASLGRLDEAGDHYQRALGMDPGLIESHFRLGNVRGRQGDLDQAITHYRRAVALNPEHAEAHHNLGDALALRGQVSEALTHFREAVRVSPDLAVTWGRLAEIVGGHPDEAIRDVDQAVTFAERAAELTGYENPQILLQLAELYGAAGRFGTAIETAGKALAVLDQLPPTPEGDELTRFIRERRTIYQAYERSQPPDR